MDIRDCVKFYDEDDLCRLTLDYPITTQYLVELASHKSAHFIACEMNDLLEYVNGNGFFITYNKSIDKYIVRMDV